MSKWVHPSFFLFRCSRGVLTISKIRTISSLRTAQTNKISMLVYLIGNLHFIMQALHQWSIKYQCCYGHYHELHITWNPCNGKSQVCELTFEPYCTWLSLDLHWSVSVVRSIMCPKRVVQYVFIVMSDVATLLVFHLWIASHRQRHTKTGRPTKNNFIVKCDFPEFKYIQFYEPN